MHPHFHSILILIKAPPYEIVKYLCRNMENTIPQIHAGNCILSLSVPENKNQLSTDVIPEHS